MKPLHYHIIVVIVFIVSSSISISIITITIIISSSISISISIIITLLDLHFTAQNSECESSGEKNEFWEISIQCLLEKSLIESKQQSKTVNTTHNAALKRYLVSGGENRLPTNLC